MSDNPSCDPFAIAALVRDQAGGAMARIADCYMGHLLAVGRCACRDTEGAPDAVQDALLAATEKLSQFRGDGSVKAWLSKMVVNACRCQERGRKNDPSWNRPMDLGEPPPAAGKSPREMLTSGETAAQVARALETLSAQERELFLLSQIQDATAPELAELYGREPGAIRAQLTRIRRKLRAELAPVWNAWNSP